MKTITVEFQNLAELNRLVENDKKVAELTRKAEEFLKEHTLSEQQAAMYNEVFEKIGLLDPRRDKPSYFSLPGYRRI